MVEAVWEVTTYGQGKTWKEGINNLKKLKLKKDISLNSIV